ncbi:unnamed protein product [Blepharisma stoltei]|uniref:Peptidase A1 domain-containing protein n=1 Tax=Blepharisma stoltei TaxID=1481888 RepID=A0AAU9J366_9CILI|nr:unnamed protein product [Blepharisma stoltei]
MLIIDGYDISKYAAESQFTFLNVANSDGFWELDSDCVVFGQKSFAGGSKARISPGTSYILGPIDAISGILKLLEANYTCSADNLGQLNCNCNENYPDFVFQLSGVQFKIKSAGYLQKVDEYCHPTFGYSTVTNTWILGDTFLRRFYTLYDKAKRSQLYIKLC